MSYSIDEVEGIGEVYAEKLKSVGVTTTDDLLVKGATAGGRKELAETTGVSEKLILEWVNHVDLMRIKGVGSEYSDLLEAAGVDTVPELAQRNAENLQVAMQELNDEKKLVRVVPTLEQVTEWINQAKDMDRVIEY